jgi:hypothetical protein
VFSGPSEIGFVLIDLLEHRYRGGLTALRTRDAFVRRKAVAVLVLSDEAVLSFDVQGNLCGREAVSYRCRKRLFGTKPYTALLRNCWTGRAGAADEERMKQPPRSPDLSPCDLFLRGYVKEQVSGY